MQLSEAIKLIQHPVSNNKAVWADLGCGDGLFTSALSQLLADESLIYAVDKNKSSLKHVEVRSNIQLKKLQLNFVNDELPFKNLEGILMANSFHFVKNKKAFIDKAFNCLNNGGYILMIEYDTDKSNFWVPYPISFNKLEIFFKQYNFKVEKLNEVPSKYHGTIYCSLIKGV